MVSVKPHWLKNIVQWVWGALGFFKQWVEKYISIIVNVTENKVYSVASEAVNMLNNLDFYISIPFVYAAKQR